MEALEKLMELNAVLRLYHSNFLNLHWNTCGEEFNDAHKSISTDYYELCLSHVDDTAEMIARLGGNALNYMEVAEFLSKLQSANAGYIIVDSQQLYKRIDIIQVADKMLGDIVRLITEVLDTEEIKNNVNAGIRSDLEAMHAEFDLQWRYINKRRLMN